jgi:hypothetical protein
MSRKQTQDMQYLLRQTPNPTDAWNKKKEMQDASFEKI